MAEKFKAYNGDEYIGIISGVSTEELSKEEGATVYSYQLTHLTDLIGNLAQTVAEQQRELDAVKRQLRGNTSILSDRIDANTEDIRTFAEELTEHKAEQADITEMLTGDIVSLDERTQPEELAQTISKELAKGARRHGVR